ncbi:hypothetical protein HF888_07160 [Bermanella marisrubri]|uniref:Uncharacterized protein n=1 Tax=Bermanella marisrubri TaxID=207949 RepID=Q1N524_9GAMM|nr:hypothetical protein [Bermanella marisrubri]EAT13254.1 hypothetical protein RED65_00800 [Oceanobacter sp. RED65] [Bermanella marisrubri]QIZ84021.1 hypothetical protein HF888_07160 [Bermanella marisrubri]
MKIYGLIALFLGITAICMAIYQKNPSWVIGGLASLYLAWTFLYPLYSQTKCDSATSGRVLEIKANGKLLGGPHQPLYDAEIAYLDIVKVFKDLPPNFIHDVSPGDVIPIKYNSKNPNTAFVDFE